VARSAAPALRLVADTTGISIESIVGLNARSRRLGRVGAAYLLRHDAGLATLAERWRTAIPNAELVHTDDIAHDPVREVVIAPPLLEPK
jgi:hypothetical protein